MPKNVNSFAELRTNVAFMFAQILSFLTFASCDLLPFSVCFFLYFFSFENNPDHFKARCHKSQLNLDYKSSWFILCCCIFVLNDLYFVDLVSIDLVLILYGFFSRL